MKDDGSGSFQSIANALTHTLVSPNVMDSNLEPANVVDVLFAISQAINRLAKAVESSGR